MTTACRSESYLNFVFALDCGPCQHKAFEDGWKQKMRLAETFLGKLKEKGLPGVREVETLVEQLKEDFNRATWNTRTLFPHAHKERTGRVSLGQFQKAPSPLSRELFPEDISEPLEVIGSDHPDYEYDWDYIASTDPIHPVDTNYAHPLDEVDPSWMLNHLSPEEFERSGEKISFDTSEIDMIWGGSLEEANARSMEWVEDTPAWACDDAGGDQAPEDSPGATSLQSQIKPYVEDGSVFSERVDMVIQHFWRVVNGTTASDPTSQTAAPIMFKGLDDAFQGLHISRCHKLEETIRTGLITSPPTPPRVSTDESCDFDSSSSTPLNPSRDSASFLTMKNESQSSFAVSQSTAAPAPKPTSS